ncbi:putative ribonuclease H protein [Glycine soja]
MADNFLGELSQQQIQPNTEDRCSWKHDQTGYYSTKSGYDLIWEAHMGANQNLDFVDIWKLKIPNSTQFVLDRDFFDHCPILLRSTTVDWGPRPFKVMDWWLKDKDFHKMVSHRWGNYHPSGWGGYALKLKLKFIKGCIRQWSLQNGVINVSKIQNLKKELNDLEAGSSDGNTIKFWKDKWREEDDLSLQEKYPTLFQVSTQQNQNINSMGILSGSNWEWKIQWRRHFFDHEIDTLAAFMANIEGIQIQPLTRDFLSWGADPVGYYSTKSAYNLLKAEASSNSEDSNYKTIWKLQIPLRASAFSWRIFKNRLPTRDNLRRRHVELPSYNCPLCDQEEETVGHIMYSCRKTCVLWWEILRWVNRMGPFPLQPNCHFLQFSQWSGNNKQQWGNYHPPGWGGYVLNHKIKLLKQCIKQWSLTNGEANARKVTMIKKELNALENVLNDRPLSQVEVTLKKSLQVQLWEAAYAYESMLRQKPRIKWLKEGDKNSTYFHRLINHRRRKKCYSRTTLDGVYFSSLDLRDKESLVSRFNELEIKSAIWNWRSTMERLGVFGGRQ